MFISSLNISLTRNTGPLLLISVFMLVGWSAQAQLSKVEKKVVKSVDTNNASAMKLWEEAVNINSGSMNFDGVYKVGQLFKARFDAIGFTTRWVDGKPFNRSGHLIAEHKGKTGG